MSKLVTPATISTALTALIGTPAAAQSYQTICNNAQSDTEKMRVNLVTLESQRSEYTKLREKAYATNDKATIDAINAALSINNDALIAYQDAVKTAGNSAQKLAEVKKLKARRDSLKLLTFDSSASGELAKVTAAIATRLAELEVGVKAAAGKPKKEAELVEACTKQVASTGVFAQSSKLALGIVTPTLNADPALRLAGSKIRLKTPPPPLKGGGTLTADCGNAVTNPDPNYNVAYCMIAGENQSRSRAVPLSASAGAFTIPGRPLQSKGFTTSLSGTKDDTAITVGWSGEWKARTPYEKDNEYAQRFSTWSAGLEFTAGEGDVFDKLPSSLNSKTTLGGSLQYNWYDKETTASWMNRAMAIEEVKAACLKDQVASGLSPFPCVGDSLNAWIYQRSGDGTFKRAEQVKIVNDLYFGSPDTNARWGYGLNAKVGLPKYSFVTGNLTPAEITTLISKDGKASSDRVTEWSLGSYIYWRLPEESRAYDMTLLGALKTAYEWKESEVTTTFCPALDTSVAFANRGCKAFKFGAPKRKTVLAPSIEGRFRWNGLGMLPAFAIAPKLEFDLNNDRFGMELPLYLFMDSKLSTAFGVKYSHASGGGEDQENVLSFVVSKSFSLTSGE